MRNDKMKKTKKRLLFSGSIAILAAVLLGFTYFSTIKNWFVGQHPHKSILSPVIHSLPTQSTNNIKSPTGSAGIDQGSSTTVKNSPITTSPGQWTTSQSGEITLKEPINNALISSGAILAGAASVNYVGYTLIDNQVGVISQGTIPVNNGAYSAKINFKSYAKGGRLDVYSTAPSGKEENIIEINVNF